jgi:subtilase family serine protease
MTFAIIFLFLLLIGRLKTLAAELQFLRGNFFAGTTSLNPLGRLPGSNQLDLVIGLNWRDPDGLKTLLGEIYDPASPNYHHYLTPGQFAERFGPTEADYAELMRFVTGNGLTVTGAHANRALLDVRGPADAVERTFHCRLQLYRHPTEARMFYAPDSEPSVDSPVFIRAVSGLDSFKLPRPNLLPDSSIDRFDSIAMKAGSGPGGSYMGNDFRAAYAPGVSLDGSGQTVGLFEFNGYFTSDIIAYETNAGLPNVTLTNSLVEGFNGIPVPNGTDITEVSLDIEMAIAMAPGLSRVIVYEGKPGGYGNDVLNQMAMDDLAQQLSSSWDFGIDANSEAIFQEFAAQGQSFFNAAGDSGAYIGGVPTPDDDPYITIVGGTSLMTSGSGGSWVSESAWQGGGGGVSAAYPIPYWQQGVSMSNNMGSPVMRNIPDVALVAANVSVIHDEGTTNTVAGTSCAAPLWAGFMAMVNQLAAANGKPPAGFINPAIYALAAGSNSAACFHDITTGNNTNSNSPVLYHAVAGYDLCTGWGTPAGSNLIAALATPDPLQVTPETGFSSAGPSAGPFNPGGSVFTLTNIGPAPVNWNVTGVPSWLTCTPTNGTLAAGGPAVTVSVTLNAAASNLVAGNYSSTLEFRNQTDAFIRVRQFNLSVWASLIQNGGFETGNFSYWILSGNTNGMMIASDPSHAHSGQYGAELGPSVSLGYLSQNEASSPGQAYLLSLWLNSSDGRTPNEFKVSWNGMVLSDLVNLGVTGWTNLQFIVTATTTNSLLQMGVRDDPSYLGLDDISLEAVPRPQFLSVTPSPDSLRLVWATSPGLRYQLQSTTNLNPTAWLNLGTAVFGSNGTANSSVLAPPSPLGFYRVLLEP